MKNLPAPEDVAAAKARRVQAGTARQTPQFQVNGRRAK